MRDSMPWLVLYAGLVNWLVSTIFVEGSIFIAPRNWVLRKSERGNIPGVGLVKLPYTFPEGTTAEEAAQATKVYVGQWARVGALVTCQLCMRVWVGFAEALYFGGPLGGWAHVIANGLLYAAVGHAILSLDPNRWMKDWHDLHNQGVSEGGPS